MSGEKYVFAFWAGKMAILSQGIKEVGRASRPVYNVGIVFDITSDLLLTAA